jgi:hypothetical protein
MAYDAPHRTIAATATATLDAGVGELYSVHIKAAADAATAVFRTGGSGGVVIAAVGAGIQLSASHTFRGSVQYSNLHVTVTGTTPLVTAEV